MKLKFLSLLSGLALLAGACSSENAVEPTENRIVKGEPSYASFSIRMAKPTRAESDNNADQCEQNINTINIYIFSAGVLETSATPEIDSDVTVPVAVSTGEKIIYAISSEKLGLEVENEITTLATFEKQLFDALASNIAEEDNFVMIGREKATVIKCTPAEATKNPVKINVDRAAAKLQVMFKQDEVTVRSTINADFSACQFTPAQCAKQMYITRVNEGMYTPLGEKVKNNGTYPGLTSVPETFGDDDFCNAVEEYSPTYAENRYMGECVVKSPTTGNTTFALVRAKATPKEKLYGNKNLPNDGTFWVAARNISASASWIFASDNDYKIIYFASKADTEKYIKDAKLGSDYKAYEYKQGLCYYRVNLINADTEDLSMKYRVLRNNYFRANVTEIKNLGAPTGPGVVPDDPDTPIEQDSYIACEINVVKWVMHEDNVILQ